MQRAKELLKYIIPLSALSICTLIYLNTTSITETVIILLAVPFSLVGAFWLLYILEYNLSVAVWVGIISPSRPPCRNRCRHAVVSQPVLSAMAPRRAPEESG
jgi:Cu/Ag efflux pump CusA